MAVYVLTCVWRPEVAPLLSSSCFETVCPEAKACAHLDCLANNPQAPPLSGDLDTGPHACIESPLLTKPSKTPVHALLGTAYLKEIQA